MGLGAGVVEVAPPSGEQHELVLGEQRAVVTEVGAGLRAYSVGGVDVVDGFDVTEPASAGRGQVLAPWPNRLENGRYTFGGRDGVAEINELERDNAIHGLVRELPWAARERSEAAVRLSTTLEAQPAYPWTIDLSLEYRLAADGLTVSCEVANGSDVPAPFGIGFHPYFTVGTDVVDDALLTVPAERWIATDDRCLPIGERLVGESGLDFRHGRRVDARRLDTAFTALRPDWRGRAVVALRRREPARAVSVWMDDGFRYVQIYTGDTLEPVERRRRGIAIEPMTCPANAFRSGTDLIRLEPGASWRGSWGVSPSHD
jgi:galactose mutarotase-like enzyme